MFNATLTKIAVTCGLTAFLALPGMAQQPRTWVSENGNDAQNCTIDHPCRTFQRAHDQTNAYGEIDVLDPADYGPVTITHPISIDGGDMGYIMGAPAIRVNTFDVALRRLSLMPVPGRSTGPTDAGIIWSAGGFLDIDGVSMREFGAAGISVAAVPSNVARRLYVKNSSIRECGSGIVLPVGLPSGTTAGSTPVRAVIDHTFIHGVDDGLNGYGVGEGIVVPSGMVQLIHSVVVDFSTAIDVGFASDRPVVAAEVNMEDTTVAYAYQGARALGANALIRIAGNNIHDNANALVTVGGGQIVSFGTNRVAGNTAAESPTSTVALK